MIQCISQLSGGVMHTLVPPCGENVNCSLICGQNPCRTQNLCLTLAVMSLLVSVICKKGTTLFVLKFTRMVHLLRLEKDGVNFQINQIIY